MFNGTARKVVGVVAAAGFIAATASSCVANDASIVVIGLLAPPVTAAAGSTASCVYQAVLTGPFQSNGVMDLAFLQQYTPVLLLGNQLVAQANSPEDRIETNNINVEGAVVIDTATDGTQLDTFTALAAAFLPPSTGGVAGLGTYAVPIVSPAAAMKLGTFTGTKRIVASIYVYGTTSGGTHIQSAQVQFEVDACYGCLVVYPAAADDPALPMQPNCSASSSTSSGSISTPCILGQDQYIDCRLCSLTYAVCQQ